jgi:hypothetical protein
VASRDVEQDRAASCLRFARSLGGRLPGGRAAMGMATAEAAGTWAALAALRTGPSAEAHAAVLGFVHELADMREQDRWWRRRRLPGPDPARAIEAALADFGPEAETAGRV